jgi:predicted acyl esterase
MRSWRALGEQLTFHADATDGSLSTTAPTATGSVAFAGSNFVNSVTFESAPVTRDTLITGLPELTLHASTTSSQVLHLIATLYATDGSVYRPISYCAIQPSLRDGVDTFTPVVPGEVMELHPQCFTSAHRLFPGERLHLRINTQSPHHVTYAPLDARVTIYTGPGMTNMVIPVIEQPTLYKDVPLQLEQ